jgi:nucleotide-binding universal stress UspA family protein
MPYVPATNGAGAPWDPGGPDSKPRIHAGPAGVWGGTGRAQYESVITTDLYAEDNMKRFLLPLDGSAFAETALSVVLGLARRVGGEVHLASIVSDLPPVPLAAGDGALITRWFEEEEGRAHDYLKKVVDGIDGSGIALRTHVRSGPVARTLAAVASEADVDLVVMTTHGRGAWQRAWLGSVADAMIRGSDRPLLLLRERDLGSLSGRGAPRHVVIPLDGSEAAEVAVTSVLPLLDPEHSKVELLQVLHDPPPVASSYLPHAISEAQMLESRRDAARAELARVSERLEREGFQVTERIVTAGDAGHGILHHVERSGADLVALATRGRGGAARLVLGSVADKVIRGAHVPVLVSHR